MARKIPPHEIVQDTHLIVKYALDFKNVIRQTVKTKSEWNNKVSRLREIVSQMNKIRAKYDEKPMEFELTIPILPERGHEPTKMPEKQNPIKIKIP